MLKPTLGALAILQVLASLATQLLVLSLVGAGSQTDAYVAAQTLPLLVFTIFSVPLQSVWQPRFAQLWPDENGWRDAQRAAQGQVLTVCCATTLPLFVTAGYWVQWLFPGFDASQHELAAEMARVLFIGCILNTQTWLLTAALRSRERFVVPELISLGGTVVMLIALSILLPTWGIKLAAWLGLARSVGVFLSLFVISGRPVPSFAAAVAERHAWRSAMPLVGGSVIYKTGPVVDRFWSSHSPPGGVTAFNLVQLGMSAAGSVLEKMFAVPVVPQLARLVAAGDFKAVRSQYRRVIAQVTLATLVVPLGLLLLYPVWADMIAWTLRLESHLAWDLWLLCFLLLGYMHVVACGYVVVSVFYAMGDTRTPVLMSLASYLLGVLIKSAAYLLWGLNGLAVASSVYYLFNLLATSMLLERAIRARLS